MYINGKEQSTGRDGDPLEVRGDNVVWTTRGLEGGKEYPFIFYSFIYLFFNSNYCYFIIMIVD